MNYLETRIFLSPKQMASSSVCSLDPEVQLVIILLCIAHCLCLPKSNEIKDVKNSCLHETLQVKATMLKHNCINTMPHSNITLESAD